MREWLADAHLLGDDVIDDEQVACRYRVYSRLDVGDCAWRYVNSYRREFLYLEESFAAS